MKHLIVAAREKAARSTKAARELGLQIRAKEENSEAVGDIETQFQSALADATADVTALNRLEAEANLEEQHTRFTRPVEEFSGRVPEAGRTPRLARQQRRDEQRMRRQREEYARIGVTDQQSYERLRETHSRAFLAYVIEGPSAAMREFESARFKGQEAFALLTTTGDLGGFLAPDDFQSEVLKDLAGFAVIRKLARVYRTGKSAIVFPTIASNTGSDSDIYSSGYAGAWKAEGYVTGGTAPTVQNQPTFGQNRIPVHVWAPNAVEVTNELLGDSDADVEGIIGEIIAETLAMDEDSGFINGTGVNQPLGLLNTVSGSSITAVNSGHATDLTHEGLIDLFTGVPSQYRQNGQWLFSSTTFGYIMKLKGSDGHPILPPNAIPGQLWQKAFNFSEFMPNAGTADNMAVIFGDFRYYGIADRSELRVQRLVERYAPNIGLLPTARLGGQILRTAAFRKLKMSV